MAQASVRNAAKLRREAGEKLVQLAGERVQAWHRYCFDIDESKMWIDCHKKIEVEVSKLKARCVLAVPAVDICAYSHLCGWVMNFSRFVEVV